MFTPRTHILFFLLNQRMPLKISPSSQLRDPQIWLKRIEDAKGEAKITICEEALQIWPSSTELWLIYLKHSNDVGTALAKCLPLSVDPKLYEAYIDHIKASKPEDLGHAFEFALNSVSFHPDSGSLWKAYIDWLSSQPVANEWEETFRRDKIRKAYKRAVTLPVSNIETLWRTYGQFETRISRVSARKFIDERSASYMKARSALKTYQSMTKGLNFSTLPNTETSVQNAPKWQQYIDWERKNPLELGEEAEVSKRVHFAYTRAVQCARWFPQLWFDAGSINTSEFWEQGAQAMPESYLLAFKLAEYYEIRNEFDKVAASLNRLISCLGQNSSLGWAELIKSAHRMKGIDSGRAVVKQCLEELAEPSSAVYVAAASLEGAAGNAKIEQKIWDSAFQKFGISDLLFVMKYIEALFTKNDLINARSVFEQAVANNSALPSVKNLWDLMLKLEAKQVREAGSDLQALINLEQRYSEQFGGVDEVSLFMRRFGKDASLLFSNCETLPSVQTSGATNLVKTAATGDANGATPAASQLPDGPLKTLLAMLPPTNVYDGPIINNSLLMQIILELNP